MHKSLWKHTKVQRCFVHRGKIATKHFWGPFLHFSTNQISTCSGTIDKTLGYHCSKMRKVFIFLMVWYVCDTRAKKFKEEEKPKWAKKDIRDYNDADLERLLDQWEEDEEPLEPDELPEHLRPQPSIDFSNIDTSKPENLLKVSKKGKTLMMFVSTTEDLNREGTETVTKLWQTGLWNNHIQVERYMIDDNRAIFMFKDGSLAWEAKDFLVQQEKCKEVTLENMSYPGKHSIKSGNEKSEKDEL